MRTVMKIDTIKKVRQVAGENIVIMQAEDMADMTRVMSLNASALELYNQLKGREFDEQDVVDALTGTYDVDEATARADAREWLEQMRKEGLIVD